MKTRKTLLRQEFLDLEEDIKQLRREIKRVKPSVWQKIRTGLKRMWLKLFSKCPKPKPINQIEEPFQIKPQVTMAVDTPSKRILMPSSSFIDNLDNLSFLMMTMSETLTPGSLAAPLMSESLAASLMCSPGSPFDFHGSYLGSIKKQPQQRVLVAPSSSWVRGVMSSSSESMAVPLMSSSGSGSLAGPLMTSTSSSAIAIPFFDVEDDELTPTNSYNSCSSDDEMFFTPLHR